MAKKKKALVCAVLLFLSGGGYLGWQANQEAIMADVKSAIVQEVGAATGARIDMDAIVLDSPVSAHADNISLWTADGGKLAHVKAASVAVNPLKLLWNMDEPAAIVSEIVLDTPSIYLAQSADGIWNVDSLLEGDDSSELSLESVITVKDGELILQKGDEQWHAENIDGTVELLGDSGYAIDVSCIENGSPVSAKGEWGSGDGTVEIEAQDLVVGRYASFFPEGWTKLKPSGTITKGSIALRERGDDILIRGEVDLADGKATYDGISLTEVAGHVSFDTEEKVDLSVSGKAMDQPVRADGTVILNKEEIELDLTVASDAFDLRAVPNFDLPISSTAAIEAKIIGAVSDLTVDGKVSGSGTAYGYSFSNLTAEVGWMSDILAVRSLTADAFGGKLVAQGAYDTSDGLYGFEVAVHQARSAMFNEYVPTIAGPASLHMTIGGRGSEPRLKGRLVMPDGQYMNKDFANLIVDFAKNGDLIRVAGASAELDEGARLALRGTIDNGSVDMQAFASELPLAWIHDETCRGGIDVEAKIGGTVDDPTASMKVHANEGAILRQPFDRMEGLAEYQGGVLTVRDFVLRDYKLGMDSGHTIQGTIGVTGDKKLDLYVDTKKIRAEALSGWINMDTRLTGNLDNQLHVTGTLDAPVLSGAYELQDGSFGKLLIAKSSGAYSLDDKGFHIDQMKISSLNTEVELMGDVTPTRQLDLKIRAVDVEPQRLYLDLPYPIEGKTSFYGKLEGTLDAPAFKGAVRSDGLTFNGTLLEDIVGNVTIRNKLLTIPEFSFREGDGQYRFDGTLRFDGAKKMKGKFITEGGRVGPLLAVLNLPDAGIDGDLSGKITIGGTMDRPNVHVHGMMQNGLIKNEHPLSDVEIDAQLDGHVITVNTFRGTQGDGLLAVQGVADLKGELDLAMAGNLIDPEILTDWFDLGIDTEGKMDFAVQLSGTMDKPHAHASVEISDVGVSGTQFDKLVGMFVVDDRMLNINQLLLSKGEYRASAYGIVPFGAVIRREDMEVEADDEIDVTLQLDNADLRVLSLLTPEVTDGIGPMKGEVRIGGTMDDPRFYGDVAIENGTIQLRQVNTPLENANLHVEFDGKTIMLNELSGTMGGGAMFGSGQATMVGQTWDDFRISLAFDKFRPESLYYTGPIDGSLIYAKGETLPQLSGNILIKDATIDIPPIPEMGESDWNMAMDVTLEVGDKVRLYNPYLYDLWLEGKAHFGRTLKYPDTDGMFKVKRGTVSYLKTDFKVTDGWAKFDQVLSFIPRVHLKAETKIDRVKVMLDIDDPADQMNLKLTSSPAMSQQNILSLLTLRSRYFDKQDSDKSGFGSDELLGMLELGLQMSFVGAVENTIREFLAVDEFKLVRDTVSLEGFASRNSRSDREDVYNVQIGKYLTDRFMLRYTKGVGYDGYNFGGYYEVNPHLRLSTSIDEDEELFYGVETHFKF
ncbi:MAG: translocation/assembly module TamB domain-containing protein [Selenomonadales bacterium]|nr:translocation/assembly module TamB domain-containing protein [Selenomonadales bacterium]